MTRLPAEWEEQDGVLLAWPHEQTDWNDTLKEVEPAYVEIVRQISLREKAIVVVQEEHVVLQELETAGARMENILIQRIPTNDTWARDFGPMTIYKKGLPRILDFGFNGWGLKFAANLDNAITVILKKNGIFGELPIFNPGMILEGGSIESDGKGTILTTTQCLLERNRNPHLTRNNIEEAFNRLFGADRVLWLDHGFLAGDDTDSHIDTLARFCPDETIIHVACGDKADEHYEGIRAMVEELEKFRTREGKPYQLIPLPWPEPKFHADGHRLPATYANFLVINGAVLVPTYRDRSDDLALEAVRLAFPEREVVGIDCLPLIHQHGSLHCVTMQLPRGVLS